MYYRDFSNHYETLGVARDSTVVQIKKAYKRLSIKLHPDKNSDSETATEDFQKLNEAHSILSNLETRTEYNELYDLHIQESLRVPKAKDCKRKREEDSELEMQERLRRTRANMNNKKARDEWQEPEVEPEVGSETDSETEPEITSRPRCNPRKNGLWAPYFYPDCRVVGDSY
ncbi:DnaJ domain-containing protein [Rhexocercosporidium sp. MPI-PUGE-AT-0058]|nr:DnaJ domain-containing protein [Rhexocercosporidium sp. MPI-PUGE-AT-0058]